MADDKTRILTAEDAARLAAITSESDDRTRVLSAEEAAKVLAQAKSPSGSGGGRTAPRLVGDKIIFFCSKGHRIVVDASLAGKRGNCSKQGCGVPVAIPIPPGLEVRPEEVRSEPAEMAADVPAEVESRPEEAAVPPPIVDVGAPPPSAGPPAAGSEPLWDFVGGAATAAAPAAGVPEAAVDWAIDVGEIDHPTARLVARLWQERSHGGVVEVHLAGGGVILPEFYDPRWSCGDHAVFAALAPDGTVTLTAVAWDQVQRVVVRQVQGKPDGMFGD
ncbi:MAG: hypothetical protein ACKOZU_06445 [Planctomycetaceae bacterium]